MVPRNNIFSVTYSLKRQDYMTQQTHFVSYSLWPVVICWTLYAKQYPWASATVATDESNCCGANMDELALQQRLACKPAHKNCEVCKGWHRCAFAPAEGIMFMVCLFHSRVCVISTTLSRNFFRLRVNVHSAWRMNWFKTWRVKYKGQGRCVLTVHIFGLSSRSQTLKAQSDEVMTFYIQKVHQRCKLKLEWWAGGFKSPVMQKSAMM